MENACREFEPDQKNAVLSQASDTEKEHTVLSQASDAEKKQAVLPRSLQAQCELDDHTLENQTGTLPKPQMHLSLSQRRADALAFLSEAALANGLKRKQRNAPYQVVLHVDAEVLADPKTQGRCCIENSGAISVASAKRLLCDAQVVKVSHKQDGSILDVGRRTRKISSRLFTALLCRDEQCVFPGCGRTDHLKAHHIRHWSEGGPTDMANVTLLCDMHHFLVHEGGFEIKGTAPDGLSFYDPEGHPIQTVLLPPVVKGDPLEKLCKLNQGDGLIIDEHTNLIGWSGERLDLDFAVSSLLWASSSTCPGD